MGADSQGGYCKSGFDLELSLERVARRYRFCVGEIFFYREGNGANGSENSACYSFERS